MTVPVERDFSAEVKTFCQENKALCILTLGLAIVGYCIGNLAGRAVVWLQEALGTAKTTNEVSQQHFNGNSDNNKAEDPKKLTKVKKQNKPDGLDGAGQSEKQPEIILPGGTGQPGQPIKSAKKPDKPEKPKDPSPKVKEALQKMEDTFGKAIGMYSWWSNVDNPNEVISSLEKLMQGELVGLPLETNNVKNDVRADYAYGLLSFVQEAASGLDKTGDDYKNMTKATTEALKPFLNVAPPKWLKDKAGSSETKFFKETIRQFSSIRSSQQAKPQASSPAALEALKLMDDDFPKTIERGGVWKKIENKIEVKESLRQLLQGEKVHLDLKIASCTDDQLAEYAFMLLCYVRSMAKPLDPDKDDFKRVVQATNVALGPFLQNCSKEWISGKIGASGFFQRTLQKRLDEMK